MTSAAVGSVLEGTQGKVKADRLILVNLSGVECHTWLNAMRDAGQPWHGELVDNLAMAKALLKAQPKAYALICYSTPESQIANCMGNDRAPSQALANWMNQVESLMELYRDYYQRITLVAQEAFNTSPKALFEHLAVRSGIALGRVTPEKPEAAADPDQTKQQHLAVNRLLAFQALQHPPARRLAEELKASSLPLLDSVELFDFLDNTHYIIKQVPQGVAKAEDNQELKAKLKDVQEENDLVIEQLHKTQEELEQYLLGNKGGHRVEKLERDIQSKNEKLHNFSQKNKQLIAKLQSVRQELKHIRESKSWKLTAPLRACMKVLGGKKGGAA